MGLLLVSLEAGGQGESFTTLVTHKRPLPAMDAHMAHQVRPSAKRCIAFSTLVRFGVKALVCALSRQLAEQLGAELASQSVVRGIAVLGLCVGRQLFTRRKVGLVA